MGDMRKRSFTLVRDGAQLKLSPVGRNTLRAFSNPENCLMRAQSPLQNNKCAHVTLLIGPMTRYAKRSDPFCVFKRSSLLCIFSKVANPDRKHVTKCRTEQHEEKNLGQPCSQVCGRRTLNIDA